MMKPWIQGVMRWPRFFGQRAKVYPRAFQPGYTLAKPSNCPYNRDHFTHRRPLRQSPRFQVLDVIGVSGSR